MSITSVGKLALAASAAAMIAACGGGDSGPGPLKYTLDDMFIARVPIDQKQKVVQTQQDYSVAKMEHAKVQADLDEARLQVGVAKNEVQQARLGEKSAREKHRAAEKTGDMNRVNRTARMIRTEEIIRRAAEQRLTYLKSKVKYLTILVRLTKEDMYAAEARYELAKAQVARDKDIRPKGFDYTLYERQAADRERRVQTWQAKAKGEKLKLDAEQKKWKSLAAEAKQARGENVASDDDDPATEPPTEPAAKPDPKPTKAPPVKADDAAGDDDDDDDDAADDDADDADDFGDDDDDDGV